MSATPTILILYAHPVHHRSRVNRPLAQAAHALPNVHLHDLYETYPDFDIDVTREQAQLERAELVAFQHPLQWYGMPALLKEWLDLVFEHGWAYGSGGTALEGKDYWLVTTTGGPEHSYQADGDNRRPFSDFLPPFQQTAQLCGMRWLPPLVLHGAQQAGQAKIEAHVDSYRARLSRYPHWPELVTTGTPQHACPTQDRPQQG